MIFLMAIWIVCNVIQLFLNFVLWPLSDLGGVWRSALCAHLLRPPAGGQGCQLQQRG